MDPKLLLVKCITLLYKEGVLGDATETSAPLVKSVVAGIKLPELIMDTDPGRETLAALKTTAMWMCENPPGHTYDRGILLQRIRVNVGEDEGLYLAFLSGIDETTDIDAIKRTCVEHRLGLRGYQDQNKVKDILKRYSTNVHFREDSVDWSTFVMDLVGEMEPFRGGSVEVSKEGTVDEISFDDPEKMYKLLKTTVEEISSDGIIKFGWQGINNLTGYQQGGRRGECVLVSALQHNFKTGFTMNLFRQAACYNKPYMLDKKKKPIIIRISTEDPLQSNMMDLYCQIMENKFQQKVDVHALDDEGVRAASEFVTKELTEMGYHIYMAQWNPTDITFHKIFDLVTSWEAKGYEVHAFFIDYLNMLSKRGCNTSGPQGSEIRDLFRRVRNFMAA